MTEKGSALGLAPIVIEILPAKASDWRQQILQIAQDQHSDTFSWDQSKLQQQLQHSQTWIAVSPSREVLAFVCTMDLQVALEIVVLATAQAHLRQGVMRQLLSALIAQRRDLQEIWLEVHVQNQPARQLYQSLGFGEVGVRKNYYADGGAAILCTYSGLDGSSRAKNSE